MSPLDYVLGALDDWPRYLALLALSLALHAYFLRRWAVGIYDPLFMLLVSNSLGWAVVLFMHLRGDIATTYLLSFCAAQIALYAGMGSVRLLGGRRMAQDMPADGSALPLLVLILAAAMHLASTLAVWSIAGLPLLRDSRLGAFVGSGGFGIIERLSDVAGTISLFAAVYLTIRRPRLRRHPLLLLFWLWYLLALAASGSKGALLVTTQMALSITFVYGELGRRRDRYSGGRTGRWLIGAATVFALGVLAVQQEGDLGAAGLGLLYRIVSYGDVYIFAYPEATIESLKGDNPLVGMFGGILSTFRLFPAESLHANLGIQFTGLIFPDLDLAVGPNPQHPVFGYHYFGALGFLFSFVIGVLTMVLHTRFYFHPHGTFLSGLVLFQLFFGLVGMSVDFDYAMAKLANTLIGLAVIVGPALLLQPDAQVLRMRRRRPAAVDGELAA